jgi:polysaccharide export outer membrane protein
MTKKFITKIVGDSDRFIRRLKQLVPALVLLALATGCQTQPPLPPATLQGGTNTAEIITLRAALVDAMKQTLQGGTNATEIISLREGDVLKISFPANANLNTTQPIRRDGMISLNLVGEVKAAGKTPKELEKDLVDLYSTQLMSKEVTVEVQSSSFPVYVSGSVLHPGKVMSDHPITALEAVMEAGGYDNTKANLKRVKIIRHEGNSTRNYIVNLKRVVDGKASESFYLKPGDIVIVPERFSWF